MSEEQAGNQPQSEAEVSTGASNDDLFGDSPASEQSATDVTGPSADDEQVEEEAETEATEEESAEAAEEETDDYLPTEQEKVFPDEVLAKYLKRYGKDEEWLSDPLNKQLLIDKINSDIEIRKQRDTELADAEEEPTLEEEAEKKPAEAQQWTPEGRQQYLKNLDQESERLIDPEMAKPLVGEFLQSLGVDPKTPEGKLIMEKAPAIGKAMMKLMVNGIQTAFSQPQFASWAVKNGLLSDPDFSGLGEIVGETRRSRAYNEVRSKNPTLPEFGSDGFQKLSATISENYPEIANVQFDKDPYKNLVKKASFMAKVAAGQRPATPAPEQSKKALEVAKTQVKRTMQAKEAAKLGAGQTKGSLDRRATGNDDIFGAVGEVSLSNRITPSR